MNDANLLGSLTYTTKAQQPFKIAYDYTKNGNIVQADVNGQVSSFVYDANDQLTKETLPDGRVNTYDYDAVGNRTASEVNGEKATFTYNDANQIATKKETAYTYDADGNLLQDEHYKYTYNQQQRLTKVTTLDDQIIASYTYDENDLRLMKLLVTQRMNTYITKISIYKNREFKVGIDDKQSMDRNKYRLYYFINNFSFKSFY